MAEMLCYTYQIFRRGIDDGMSKKNKKQNGMSEDIQTSQRDKTIFNKVDSFFKHPLVVGILVVAIPCFWASAKGVFALPGDVKAIKESLSDLETETSDISTRLVAVETEVKELKGNMDRMENRVNVVESRIDNIAFRNIALKLQPTDKAIESIGMIDAYKNNEYYLNAPSWISTDVIAVDLENDREYQAVDLIGEKLLLPYIKDGQEVFFCGQFDENNQWDGECLINVYKDDQLSLIMEAEYEGGTLKKYKQVLAGKTLAGTEVWIVAERENSGESNSGNSWNYIRDKAHTKEFEFDEVEIDDMMTVRDFESSIDTRVEGFYHGDTSNGTYNDQKGDAYLIKYAEDGTVRTLYVGGFRNGKFDDVSGDAWYITKSDNTAYMYFKGNFENGDPIQESKKVFENELTMERITEILQENSFECENELKWQIDISL